MILDENLFEIKEARGSKEGVKRGSYNKEKSKSKEDLYDELQDRLEKEFYFPGVAKSGDLKVNLIMKDENKAELKGKKPARLIASSMSKYRDIKDEKELDTAKKIAKEMGFKTELDKTKRVPTLIIKLEESLNEKKSNRLTYHEFVDYLDSIDNGYTGFAKVTGNKGSGYRYTLSNKLTREQHDYLAQYDNVDFGIAQYRYAPEIKYDTVILLDRMSKTSPMKEDYDEDFFYTYEAIRYGESDPNRKYSGDFEDENEAVELAKDDGYDEVVRYTYDFISDNFDDYWGMPPRRTDTIWTKESGYLNEDIVKTSKGKWVNKGKEGTHGEFTTKKKAREQQKAIFASGWKGESLEESADRVSIESDFEDITNMSDAKERLKKYDIDLIKKDNRNYILRKNGKEYTFYVLDNPNEVRKDLVKVVYKLTESANSKKLKENIGSDIAEYQKWVDYDMKKYGRISSLTNHKVRKAGLKIVKDKYDDYEVIASEPIREDIEMDSTTPDKSKINFNINDNGDFTFTINGKEYKGHTDKPEDMSKDLKDFGFSLTEDVEVVDKNQAEIDKKAGLENLLNDLINDENEAINGYNSAIVNFELEGKSDLTNVFRDIIKDEQNHIGNLQKVLNEINPTTIANLEQGQEEAADTLNK